MNIVLSPSEIKASLPKRPGRGRRPWSFLIVVVIPTLLVFGYLSLIASPLFVTQFRFAIVTLDSAITQSATGQAATSPTPTTTPNPTSNWVVVDYLNSRQVIEDLRKKLNLMQIIHARNADPLLGFWWDDGSPERLAQYWRNFVVDTDYDIVTGLGMVSVRTYSPQDSLRLSQALAELSEDLVNEVSMRPRQAAIRFAEASYARANKQLLDIQNQQEAFHNRLATTSPNQTADAQLALVAQLQTNLAGLSGQLASVQGRLAPSAPSIQSLNSQIAAAQAELAKAKSAIGQSGDQDRGGMTLAQVVADGKLLDQQAEFALAFRNATELRLEQARYDAEVQHDYLQLYVKPQIAKRASYPHPLETTFITFSALFVTWSVGMLLYFAMRDHTA